MSKKFKFESATFLSGGQFNCTFEVTSMDGAPLLTVEAETFNRGEIVDILHAAWVDTSAAAPAVGALSFVTNNAPAFFAEMRSVATAFYAAHDPSAEAVTTTCHMGEDHA